ncbi:MAG: flagellar biosynthesis protein FlhB, partial [Nitrospirae bacterium]
MKRKRAIALKYDRYEDPAPRVVAKGEGKIAERIIEIAREKGIFIKKDPLLADLL